MSCCMMAKVTASIVTYKTDRDELKKCVDALTDNDIFKIYICDNSPNNDLQSYCHTLDRTEYIYNGKNLGYGAAHNVAIRKAIEDGTDYHIVINSDVYFGKGVISKLAEYMNAHTDVAQVQPNIVYPDGRMQYTCRMLPTPANVIFRRFLPKRMVEKMNWRYLLKFNDHSKPMNIPYHQGSFMFFRTECFKTVGLFDERFFMYPEDIDITRRMHRRYKTMFLPDVTIVHAHRAASYKSLKMLYIHVVNMIKYFNKWGWIWDRERREWNKQILKEYGQ